MLLTSTYEIKISIYIFKIANKVKISKNWWLLTLKIRIKRL